MINRPTYLNENRYFTAYIHKAIGSDLISSLRKSGNETLALIGKLDEEQANFKYAKGKWSVKQVLKHITDSERVFAYRALRISRKDITSLPGFDEKQFADLDYCDNLSLEIIKDEFIHVRNATIALFKTMDPAVLDFEGSASLLPISPRILGWVCAGHNEHHIGVIQDRYIVKMQSIN